MEKLSTKRHTNALLYGQRHPHTVARLIAAGWRRIREASTDEDRRVMAEAGGIAVRDLPAGAAEASMQIRLRDEARGYRRGLEAAARACDEYAAAASMSHEDDEDVCQEAYRQGEASGARDCALEIRALATEPAPEQPVERRVRVGLPWHVELWDAINAFTVASGGRVNAISGARMDAVVRVERALAALVAPEQPAECDCERAGGFCAARGRWAVKTSDDSGRGPRRW